MSNMTVKKSNHCANGRPGETASNKQRPKATTSSRGQEPMPSQGRLKTGMTSSGVGSSLTALEERMYCNDPEQVQQWAANSAANITSFEDPASQESYSISYGSAAVMARSNSYPPGSFPMSCSSVSHVSLQQSTPEFGNGPETGYNDLHACNAGASSGLGAGLNLQQAPGYGGNIDSTRLQYLPDALFYPTSSVDTMLYTGYAAIPETVTEGQGHNVCFQPDWPQMSCSNRDEAVNTGAAFQSNPISGSPLSAIDPSVSSSYSQNSLIGPEPDTPVSQAIQEGKWSPDLENPCFQGFNIGESMHYSPPADYTDQLGDGLRLVYC